MAIPPLSLTERIYIQRLTVMCRGFQYFWAHYEDTGQSEIVDPDRIVWNVHDLRYFYEHLDEIFPERQATAVRLHLFHDMSEEDTARAMKVKPTTPVSIYVRQALRKFSPEITNLKGMTIPTSLGVEYRSRILSEAA